MKPRLPTAISGGRHWQGIGKLLATDMSNALIQSRDRFCRQYPEQRILVNHRDWGVIEAGSHGPALLLLPGTLGRADIFWHQIESLSGEARILALTYPETGDITDWCEDIATLMAAKSINSTTVLGSSLGGYIAQYFAATRPELVDNLIAANTLPAVDFLQSIPPYSADLDALPAEDLMLGFNQGLSQWMIDEPDRQDLVELLLAEVSGRIPAPELRARLNALKRGPELPKQTLAKAHIFTVESDDDRLIPAPVREAVRASLNPIRCEIFKHGSHFPYLTNATRYSEMIREIIAS